MGLERLVSFLQGVESAFDCDVFGPILKSIGRHSGISYERATPEQKVAFRVLADHIRSTCLAIADGGMPSNEGRGYVIRKIIRRAALFAQKLGSSTLFADLAKDFIGSFGEIYPELIANKTLIEKTVKDEVQKFEQNLTQGVAIFKTYLANATKDKIISGEQAFKLYDTYGFPLELTCLLAEDEDFTVDISGFEAAMEQQRLQSGKKTTTTQSIAPANLPETKFVGYDSYSTNSKIIFISNGREPVKELAAGEEGYIVTDQTPFYVEGGGQVSDFGTLEYQGTIMPVQAVKREHGTSIVHKVQAAKNLAIGATVTLHIDKERRAAIQRNHTATHLLQSALMNVLGAHVKQAGSYVSSDVARFDFTHHSAPTAEVLKEVEHLVNAAIMRAIPVTCNVTSYQDAISKGVIAFFGDKYNPDAVRVVQVPGVSAELCGGTHVKNTGEIGCFKITESSALSSGIRRITAVTGFGALETFDQALSIVHTATNLFKAKPEDLPTLLAEKQERLLALEKELQKKEKELLLAQLLSSSNRTSGSTALHMIVTTEGNPKDFRDILKDASKKINGTLVILASTEKGTAFALQINTNTLTPEMIIKNLAEQFGLKGRAQGNFIQGGGSAVDIKLLENKITSWFAA
ncbi:TPA: alanine--tRNA ligase [Candidatus Dependentiae bacterium]|nr:alanine--tRNA ligase [Candidatus Dependentiae bacterium]